MPHLLRYATRAAALTRRVPPLRGILLAGLAQGSRGQRWQPAAPLPMLRCIGRGGGRTRSSATAQAEPPKRRHSGRESWWEGNTHKEATLTHDSFRGLLRRCL